MKKVVFFSPSADIWAHSFPEALTAEMLRGNGVDAVMVRCAGALRPLCPAGQAAGFTADTPSADQLKLCVRCGQKADLMDTRLGLRQILLDDFISPEDDLAVAALKDQADRLRPELYSAEDFGRLECAGLPVGRYALYELILRYKKNDFELSDASWREFLLFLEMAARTALASEKILRREQPDSISVYNSLYAPHRAFSQQAVRQAIAQYFMHAGTNLSRQHCTLMIGQDFTWKYLLGLVDRYAALAHTPTTAAAIEDVSRHFEVLFTASNIFVYSAARSAGYLDVRGHFGVAPEQRLIVASTSSYDERFAVDAVGAFPAAKSLLFPRILDWLEFLIAQARERPDWFLLIRVHPREFPNRRDAVKSAHVQKMQELLRELPSNVCVNWPGENISLYDLAQEADLFLNAWSSVGKEMALLGLPVVIYSPELVLYPPSLNYVGTTQAGYLQAIHDALRDGWSLERSRQAYRWFALEFSRSCVDLHRGFSPHQLYRGQFWWRVVVRLARSVIPIPQERWDVAIRRKMPVATQVVRRLYGEKLETSFDANDQAAFDGDAASEEAAIRASLARLGDYLFQANPANQPSRLQRLFNAAGVYPHNIENS